MNKDVEEEAAAAAASQDVDVRLTYKIERPVYHEAFIQSQLLHHNKNSRTLRERLAQRLSCSARSMVLSVLPILTWLPAYPVKENLFSDVVSGLSTGVVQLPQGLAYAMLAAVPPVYGLYSSFYPVLLYTFFGTSRHISVGTFAVISLMIGGVVVREAPDSMFYVLPANASTNMSAILDVEARDARRVQVAVVLTTLVGIIQIVFGLLRFGFVSIYLTEPLVRGFTTAAAVHVVVSQLKYLLGVKTQRFSGPLSAIYSAAAVFCDITNTNISTLILGLACLVFLYAVKDINERFKKKLPIPVPGEIIVVIVSTGVSYGLGLSDRYQVDVVGNIPTGLLPPAVPEFSLLPNLVTDSFTVAIVGFSMGISLAKTFALKHNYSVDGNQELIAFGLCNFISSFFQTFAITCSMSRSLVQESTGGKTQIAGLLSSLVVLLVVVAIGFVFQPLPQTALAAIIMVNLLGMFKQFRDIPSLWRTSRIELAIWLVSFVASVLLGLDYGLLVAVTFTIITVIYRTQSPKSSVLGHVAGSGLYCDADEYKEAAECEGIKIFHFNSSIYFANSDLYVNSLKQKTGVNPEHLQASRKVQKKKEQKANGHQKSALQDAERGVTHELLSYNHVSGNHGNGQLTHGDSDLEDAVFLPGRVHSIVLDWTNASFTDSVGAKAVKQVIKEYAAVDVRVVIAGCSRNLLSQLDSLQFFTGSINLEMMFPTVHDAVLHCCSSSSSPSSPSSSSPSSIQMLTQETTNATRS